MALYTILFGLSIFMIALVIAIIKKMFFEWKEKHEIESKEITHTSVERPAVSVIISAEKCVIRCRKYSDEISVFDIITKSDISLTKRNYDMFLD